MEMISGTGSLIYADPSYIREYEGDERGQHRAAMNNTKMWKLLPLGIGGPTMCKLKAAEMTDNEK